MTQKQKKFVEEYLKDEDVVSAYLRAGFAKYNMKTAAQRLFELPQIQQAIEKAKTKKPLTLEEAKEILSDIIMNPKTKNSEKIKAIERMAKMSAWDAAEKSDVTSGGLPLVPTEIVFFKTQENQETQEKDKNES